MISPLNTVEANEAEHRRRISETVNLILQGRINSVGTLTIASGATTTAVNDVAAHIGSVPLLIPMQSTTLNPYVSARAKGSFTLSHASAPADTTYLYVLLG